MDHATKCLEQAFPNSAIQVRDPRGDGIFLTISVQSNRFDDLTVQDQHRLVYQVLKRIHNPEHLSIRTVL